MKSPAGKMTVLPGRSRNYLDPSNSPPGGFGASPPGVSEHILGASPSSTASLSSRDSTDYLGDSFDDPISDAVPSGGHGGEGGHAHDDDDDNDGSRAAAFHVAPREPESEPNEPHRAAPLAASSSMTLPIPPLPRAAGGGGGYSAWPKDTLCGSMRDARGKDQPEAAYRGIVPLFPLVGGDRPSAKGAPPADWTHDMLSAAKTLSSASNSTAILFHTLMELIPRALDVAVHIPATLPSPLASKPKSALIIPEPPLDEDTVSPRPTVTSTTGRKKWGPPGASLLPDRCWQLLATRLDLGYKRQVPYHNVVHAADVTWSFWTLLRQVPELLACMTTTERLAALFAAAAHDVGHPGVSNGFLAGIRDPAACRVGDSPLENYHASCLFELLQDPEADVTRLFECNFADFRQTVQRMILGTDMEHHKANLVALKQRNERAMITTKTPADQSSAAPPPPPVGSSCYGFDFTKADERRLALCELLHAADLGSLGKPLSICRAWGQLVQCEMNQLAAEEALHGLPLNPLAIADFDRSGGIDGAPFMKNQIFFLNAVIVPYFTELARSFPSLAFLSVQAQSNLDDYVARVASLAASTA